MVTKAIVVSQTGGPEVLQMREQPLSEPGAGEALIRHRAIGLNFIDIYLRAGVYPVPVFPFVPGMEAAGVVEAIGPGVTEVKIGDRVAYALSIGAYCESRIIPARILVKVPDAIDDATAAAVLLKGMTAHFLCHSTYAVKPGEPILVHAAAGGVGLILCQWAKHLGAVVIGTVGSDDKAALAATNGCDHTVVYSREDFVARVREITGGRGVGVVYDSVGEATFLKSLECIRPRGLMVSFGQASGIVAPLSVNLLANKGSLYLTRPTLGNYVAGRDELLNRAAAVFDALTRKIIRCEVKQRFPLAHAAEAHRALAARQTTGSTVLLP